VRRAAAAALVRFGGDRRAAIGAALLVDPVRTVRLESVLPMADVAASLRGKRMRAGFEAAVAEFRRSQRHNADRAEARVNLGSVEYEAAIRLDPHAEAGYLGLAGVHQAAGRERDVEETLRAGLARRDSSGALHHAMGLALVRQRRLQDAIPYLRDAAALDRGSPRLAWVYAVALHDAGARNEAVRVLEAAMSRFPADSAMARALAVWRREGSSASGRR
jgi:predicted Zn-dependent protease